jgi:hypothetical protein
MEVEMSEKAASAKPKAETPTGIRLQQKLAERGTKHFPKK